MKTYSETQGKTFFDWNAFLKNPPEKGSEEHYNAEVKSEDWVTCACGNLCDIIPRSHTGCPIDNQLEILGGNFYIDITLGDWQKAKEMLVKIENRSAELIKEYIKKFKDA